MQNCYIQVIWNYINDKNYTLHLSSKCVGVGLNLALLKDDNSGDPQSVFFFFSKMSNDSS